MLIILLKSLVVGFLGGFGLTAGAARMFHTPTHQSMGAFRTLGELNACQGDPISHFSFGLGFLFNSAASSIGAGALTQDVFHRIVPNFAAASLLFKNKKVEETLYDPYKMGIAGGIIGAVVVVMLNTMAAFVPIELAKVAKEILTPKGGISKYLKEQATRFVKHEISLTPHPEKRISKEKRVSLKIDENLYAALQKRSVAFGGVSGIFRTILENSVN